MPYYIPHQALHDPATPIFGAVTIVTVNNTTSGVVAVPTGTTEHDRLVLWIAKTEAATFTGLTGWTQTIAEESVPGAMLYCYEKEAGFTGIGNALPLSTVTHPAICALSATKIAYIDGTNDQLRTYDFDGTDWVMAGTPLTISGSVENAICALSSTRIARIDFGAQSLQAYDLSAGAWSAVGNGLAISGTGFPALCALSSTRIAFIDGVNDSLRAYDFDGTDWTLVGNAFAISGTGGPALAKLSSTRVAFIDGLHDELRAYDFNGTDWTLTGNALAISTISEPRLCALGAGRVIFVSNEDVMRCYDFDGTNWTQTGGDLSILGVDYPALAALDATTFVFVDGLNDSLRTYGFDLAASYTPAWSGADDAVIYMINVDQCGGSTFKGTDIPDFAAAGNPISITGMGFPSVAALSSSRVAFTDTANAKLSAYDFNGTNWTLVGNALAISGMGSIDVSITALSSTRVAFIDAGNAQLRAYDFDGTDWTLTGNGLAISGLGVGGAIIAIAALSSTRIAFVDSSNDTIRAYDFDGTDWTLTGNSLAVESAGGLALAALSSSRVAFGGALQALRVYAFDGTNWSQVGNSLSLSGVSYISLAALSSQSVAYADNKNDELRIYAFDGSDWSEVGAGTSLTAFSGANTMTNMGGGVIAFADGTNDSMKAYSRATTAPTCPALSSGSANNLALRAMVCQGAPTVTEPAGTTAVGATASPNNELTLALAYEAVATAGTDIGAGAFALSAAQPWAAASVLLRAGDENSEPPVLTLIDRATGTAIGDATGAGGLAAAYDGNTAQAQPAAAWRTGPQANLYIGKNYSAAPKGIGQAIVYPSTDLGYTGDSVAGTIIWTLYGKNGGAPSAYNDGTSLGSVSGANITTGSRTITSSDSATLYDYVWVAMTKSGGSGDGGGGAAEVQFYEYV